MIELRPFQNLGSANHGWLDAKYHFSFADYHDAERMGWGSLRVWNDDTIEPHCGFSPHPHANMEIITYVRKGAITHRDHLGHVGRTEAGDVQVMSAGTGIVHSERNLERESTQIFQIWIHPSSHGHQPGWGTRSFPKGERAGRFVVLASGLPGDVDSLKIHANARVLGAALKAGEKADYAIGDQRLAYLVPAKGVIEVNGVTANARDGVAISAVEKLHVTAMEDAEIVLVDVV